MVLEIIAVRVTQAEKQAIMVAAAQAGGLRPSSYFRKLAGLDPLKNGGARDNAGPKRKKAKQ